MMAKAPSDRYQEPAEVVAALAEWAQEPAQPPSEAELPRLSRAARTLLDARPRLSQPAADSQTRRAPLPVLAAPPPAPVTAIAIDSGRRAPVVIPSKPRFPRRGVLVAAAAAALAMVGTRINPFAPGSPEGPPTSTPATGKPSGLVSLLGSVAELDSQIEPEKNPAIKGSLLLKRGALNSRLARWRQAADDFRRASQLDPGADWTWYYAIVTLVEIGEKADYRELCLGMQQRFESSTDPLLAERIAKLWLLTPECPGDPAIPSRLIDRALAEGPNQKLYYWVMSTKGIAEYRAGHLDEAASWLRKAIDVSPPKAPQCKAISGLFLAMGLRRQNLADQARQAYDRAAEIIDQHQRQYGGDFGTDWCDWLMCSIIRREADQTMGLAR
jgi:tetratricopeptide (TPR) repeat protein